MKYFSFMLAIIMLVMLMISMFQEDILHAVMFGILAIFNYITFTFNVIMERLE